MSQTLIPEWLTAEWADRTYGLILRACGGDPEAVQRVLDESASVMADPALEEHGRRLLADAATRREQTS